MSSSVARKPGLRPRASFPTLRLVDTRSGVVRRPRLRTRDVGGVNEDPPLSSDFTGGIFRPHRSKLFESDNVVACGVHRNSLVAEDAEEILDATGASACLDLRTVSRDPSSRRAVASAALQRGAAGRRANSRRACSFASSGSLACRSACEQSGFVPPARRRPADPSARQMAESLRRRAWRS